MPIGDVYRITANWALGSILGMNSHYFRMKTAPDPTVTQLQTVANLMKELTRVNQHQSMVFLQWRAEQMHGGTVAYTQPACKKTGGILLTGNFSGVLTGAVVTGETLPFQDALVLSLKTGLAGRSKRGRMYIAGHEEGQQAASAWTGAHLTNVGTAVTTYLAAVGTTGTNPDFQWGVWSTLIATGCRTNPVTGAHEIVAQPSPATAYTPITEVSVRSTVRSQRRRQLGIGQ